MKEYDVIFFTRADGTEPAREFIESLEPKMLAKVLRAIEYVRDYGTYAREPYSKHIEDGIFEIRAKVGSDISRVMYFFYVGRKIILTNGFIKKAQKTPVKEIVLAKKYREEYLSHIGGEKNE